MTHRATRFCGTTEYPSEARPPNRRGFQTEYGNPKSHDISCDTHVTRKGPASQGGQENGRKRTNHGTTANLRRPQLASEA